MENKRKIDPMKETNNRKPKVIKKEKLNEVITQEEVITVEQKFIKSPTVNKSMLEKTVKQIYEQYIIDLQPYKIYVNGQLIFDSNKSSEKPNLFDDYFILFGNKYIYKGIRFEKY
jgi:hypothetical protein